MAAALLMMNMQGAVMAADKDQTIFRYSDKVPFALMTDPQSRLPWDEIWEGFRSSDSIMEDVPFESQVSVFENYLQKYLKDNPDILYFDKEWTYKIICVGYESGDMFPRATILRMYQANGFLKIDRERPKPITIDRNNSVFYQSISKSSNLKILFGGMSAKIAEALQDEMARQWAGILETEDYLIKQDPVFLEEYYDQIDDVVRNHQVEESLRFFTIKDMVAMEENLIDMENLNQSSTTALGGSYTREIATLTLAEGFKWIKHSLYSA